MFKRLRVFSGLRSTFLFYRLPAGNACSFRLATSHAKLLRGDIWGAHEPLQEVAAAMFKCVHGNAMVYLVCPVIWLLLCGVYIEVTWLLHLPQVERGFAQPGRQGVRYEVRHSWVSVQPVQVRPGLRHLE